MASNIEQGNAVLVHDATTAQGFAVRTAGPNRRDVADVDGLWLAKVKPLPGGEVPWDMTDLLDVDEEYIVDGDGG